MLIFFYASGVWQLFSLNLVVNKALADPDESYVPPEWIVLFCDCSSFG